MRLVSLPLAEGETWWAQLTNWATGSKLLLVGRGLLRWQRRAREDSSPTSVALDGRLRCKHGAGLVPSTCPKMLFITKFCALLFNCFVSTEAYVKEVEDGLCYLPLFEDSEQVGAQRQFGYSPDKAALLSAYLKNPARFTTKRTFTATIQRPPGFKMGYYLAHIEVSPPHISAMTVAELLHDLPSRCKVGEMSQVDTTAMPVPTQPSQPASTMQIRASPVNADMVYQLNLNLTDSETKLFSPTNDLSVRLQTARFESVTIENVFIEVELPAGSTSLCRLAVSPSTRTPTDMNAEPVRAVFTGSSQGVVIKSWTMPQNSFGKEIKAVAIGNPPMQFHFKGSNCSSTSPINVRIYLTVHETGRGVMPPIDVTTATATIPKTMGSMNVIKDAYNSITIK